MTAPTGIGWAERVVLVLAWISMGLGVGSMSLALNLTISGHYALALIAAAAMGIFAILPIAWYRHNNRELRRLTRPNQEDS